MERGLKKLCFSVLAAALFTPVTLLAQDDTETKNGNKETEQITIIRKGDKTDKMVIEVTGDKILVNGKEVKEGADGDLIGSYRARTRASHASSSSCRVFIARSDSLAYAMVADTIIRNGHRCQAARLHQPQAAPVDAPGRAAV